jgi:N-methylhydantoinase A
MAQTVLMDEADIAAGRAVAVVRELSAQAAAAMTEASLEVTWDLRYAGQAFELPITAPADADVAALRERFERAHAERYGYADPHGRLELVNVRVSATAPRGLEADVNAQSGAASPVRRTAMAEFGKERVKTSVLSGAPEPGEAIGGPAVIELAEATIVVPPEWSARTDPHGAVILDRVDAG